MKLIKVYKKRAILEKPKIPWEARQITDRIKPAVQGRGGALSPMTSQPSLVGTQAAQTRCASSDTTGWGLVSLVGRPVCSVLCGTNRYILSFLSQQAVGDVLFWNCLNLSEKPASLTLRLSSLDSSNVHGKVRSWPFQGTSLLREAFSQHKGNHHPPLFTGR